MINCVVAQMREMHCIKKAQGCGTVNVLQKALESHVEHRVAIQSNCSKTLEEPLPLAQLEYFGSLCKTSKDILKYVQMTDWLEVPCPDSQAFWPSIYISHGLNRTSVIIFNRAQET